MSRTSDAATRLRRRIATGQLAGGAKLNEVHLAEDLGISRNTLREVFATLSSEGLLERVAHRGVFVAVPGPEQVREMYRLRRLIEPAVLLWSEDLDVAELSACGRRAAQAVQTGDIVAASEANQDFHRIIIECIGSSYASEVLGRMLGIMRLVFTHAQREHQDFPADFARENARIAELAAAGRREQAAEAMRSYLRQAESQLLRVTSDDRIIEAES